MSSPSNVLKLDPGPQPRRRAQLSCCRCVLWTVLTLIGLAAAYGAYVGLRFAVRFINAPHYKQLQNPNVPYKPNEVLKPLVGSEQTFDVVATVWVRRDGDRGDGVLSTASIEPERERELVEDVVYSDTVFTGLVLKDKSMKTTVNFSVPTDVFKEAELWNYDLRASFVLVPNSPSPLDFAVNYSSWIPKSIYYPPMRPRAAEGRTLADEIVDSFGVFVPLLEFHPIASSCENSIQTEAEASEDEDDDNWDMPATSLKADAASLPEYKSTKDKLSLQAHPYVTTRTHIRVSDLTAIYNRALYDAEHKSLASKSCGQDKSLNQTSWKKCRKTYLLNGNMETRIKLRTHNSSTGANMTEWAYAPYMIHSDVANGPLDLMPVPISREKCPDVAESTGLGQRDSPSMNITWNIAFSGRTPPKWMAGAVAQLLVPVGSRNMSSNMTEFDIHAQQAQYALLNGVVGHNYDGKGHPRLLFLAFATSRPLALFGHILGFYYWFTRFSTVGISINGAILCLVGSFSLHAKEVMLPPIDNRQKPYTWAGAIFYLLISSVTNLFMLKTIARIEVRRKATSWFPTISVCEATHAERASQRVDGRTQRRRILMVYVALAAFFFLCYKFDIHVASIRGIRRPLTKTVEISSLISALLINPCSSLGMTLQIVINSRHNTFAGLYKLTAWINFMSAVCQVIIASPGLYRFSSLRVVLGVPLVVNLVLRGILVWQSVIYPPASQALKEEDIE